MPGLVIKELGSQRYPELLDIWAAAVKATHQFLNQLDFDELYSRLVQDYLPAVKLYGAFFDKTDETAPCLGFIGLSKDASQDHLRVEMLFVAPSRHSQGIGSKLLNYAKSLSANILLDVNEQNPGALGFYLKHGFTVLGRSPLDAEGRAYPLLHLGYTQKQ